MANKANRKRKPIPPPLVATRANRISRPVILLGVVALLAGLAVAWFFARPLSREATIRRAQDHLSGGRYMDAQESVRRYLARFPDDQEMLVLGAEALEKLGQQAPAAEYYDRLQPGAGDAILQGHLRGGELSFALGHASSAERHFRAILQHRPADPVANRQLGLLLTLQGRRWESEPLLAVRCQLPDVTVEELLLLANLSRNVNDVQARARFSAAAPADKVWNIETARLAIEKNELLSAKHALEVVLQHDQGQIEAWAWLGGVLLELGKQDEYLAWHADLPEAANSHPQVWIARAQWSRQHRQERESCRCYWEALRRDPNHDVATYQLAMGLHGLRDESNSRLLLARITLLRELAAILEKIFPFRNDDLRLRGADERLRRVADILEQLGRYREAAAWWRTIARLQPADAAVATAAERLAALATKAPQLVIPELDPARLVDLQSFPLPRILSPAALRPASTGHPSEYGPVRFSENAAALGLQFQYNNGGDGKLRGIPIHQVTGGGIAVLDYDNDYWPDMVFTQGCSWPVDTANKTSIDRLYRNLQGRHFADVTAAAGLGDERFSQGATVGDFDNDGFADLYVANIGQNRLYRNNGDGTFSDQSQLAGITDPAWTLSCVMADFNHDSWPDLFDATYIAGEDFATRLCNNPPRTCPPTAFAAPPDRLWLNLGDGRFQNVSSSAGVEAANGYGMGVVAADLTGNQRLSLFVANDETANFLFQNDTPKEGGQFQFRETGVLSGLGFDGDGRPQACMGVAADDVNADGKLDLFVTNYYSQSNTLYLQEQPGFFVDATAAAGLRAPSYLLLGFGTQFLDADLDGRPDLILTNGHVDDYTHQNIPFRMRPQFFRNAGEAQFLESSSSELGPFFEGAYLGRGLALIDWNRDGREDAVISHLDVPAALLTNETIKAGHYMTLQLVATASARDAIGAEVTVITGQQKRVRQLTAGSGYAASNQRQLIFGLGKYKQADKLLVRWPSGRLQVFDMVPGDAEWIAVEGDGQLHEVP